MRKTHVEKLASSKTGQVFEHAQEGLLRDILGVLFLPDDPESERINLAFVTGRQRLERVQVACFGAPDELGIWCLVGRRRVSLLLRPPPVLDKLLER